MPKCKSQSAIALAPKVIVLRPDPVIPDNLHTAQPFLWRQNRRKLDPCQRQDSSLSVTTIDKNLDHYLSIQPDNGSYADPDTDAKPLWVPSWSTERSRLYAVRPGMIHKGIPDRSVLNRITARFKSLKNNSNWCENPIIFRKVLPSNVAQESRPPLQGDMDIPSACTYSPMVKPPQMANSPAWSFGAKCHTDRAGGERKSWGKNWFHNSSVWTTKLNNQEQQWPGPAQYQHSEYQSSDINSCTFGKSELNSSFKTEAELIPAPNKYDRSKSDVQIYSTPASFSLSGSQRMTTLWPENSRPEKTPGPGSYSQIKTTYPLRSSFRRREKPITSPIY